MFKNTVSDAALDAFLANLAKEPNPSSAIDVAAAASAAELALAADADVDMTGDQHVSGHKRERAKTKPKPAKKKLRKASVTEVAENVPDEDRESVVSISMPKTTEYSANVKSLLNTLITEHKFTQEQLNKILKRQKKETAVSRTLTKIIEDYDTLVALKLTNEQIINIATPTGGSHNLAAFISHYKTLKSKGFQKEQIVRMAMKGGGENNINAVVERADVLMDKGFSLADITTMVGYDGGSKNIEAVARHVDDLLKHYSPASIVKMAKGIGGHKQINQEIAKLKPPSDDEADSVHSDVEALLKKGFTQAQIDKIQKTKDSAKIFSAINAAYETLSENLKLNCEQITKIAKHDGAVIFIEYLVKHNETLVKEPVNFSNEEIVSIIAHNGGANNMEELLASYATLTSVEIAFTKNELIQIAGVKGGAHNLRAVKKYFKDLSKIEIGCSKAQIIKLAAKSGGSQAIEALLEQHGALKAKGYNNEQIINMASHEGARKTIATVLEQHDELRALGFTHEQISFIAGQMGGTSNIEALLKHFNQLKELGLTHEQMRSLTEIEGSAATIIDTLCEYKDLIKVAELKLELIVGLMSDYRKNKKFVNYLAAIKAYASTHSESEVIIYAQNELPKTFSRTVLAKLTGVAVIEASSAAALKPRTANEVTIPSLIKKGFSQEALNKITKLTGNELTLTALNDSYEALKSLGLTYDQMLQLAVHEGGSNNIRGFINYYATLMANGFSLDQIVNMTGHGGGEKTLKAVNTKLTMLTTGLKFKLKEIVTMAASSGAANAIDAVISNHEELTKCGFENSQIADMASYAGSSKTLPSVVENFAVLEKLGFSIAQMVKLACCISASKNIEMVAAEEERILRLTPSIDQMIVRINAKRKGALDEFLSSCDGLQVKLAQLSASSAATSVAATPSTSASSSSSMPFRTNLFSGSIPLKPKAAGGAGAPPETSGTPARRY